MVIVLLMGTCLCCFNLYSGRSNDLSVIYSLRCCSIRIFRNGTCYNCGESYGPVTDNAQSVYELSLIEEVPNVSEEIEKEYGFKPDFENAKKYLEENDGAGNTFKATSKPVLIGTAVVGATTMIFSLILVTNQLWELNLK